MLLDLKNKLIYAENGQLIKKLHCPQNPNWEEFEAIEGKPYQRNCNHCQHAVVDTAFFQDDELKELVAKNPSVCFKIDLTQKNVILIENGAIKKH